MDYGICNIGFIPVRKDPDHRSEMVSQILFGETYTIVEEEKKWTHILCHYDGYQGWVDNIQVFKITEEDFNSVNNSQTNYQTQLFENLNNQTSKSNFQIPFGASLFSKIKSLEYEYNGEYLKLKENKRVQIIDIAKLFLHTPYLWGGRTPFGIDCSGFTQIVFKVLGIKLLRDASQQSMQGSDAGFVSEAMPGDLAFFGDEENISHVGIIDAKGLIIHSSGRVRFDKVDHNGIYNAELKKYTHSLRVIRNIID